MAGQLICKYKKVIKKQNIEIFKLLAALDILQLLLVVASVVFDKVYNGDKDTKDLINNLKSLLTYPVF